MTNLAYPYQFDGTGGTASAIVDDHIRDLIEQTLFTSPGERVNRPTFGTGVMQLVFAPNSDALSAATQFLVQGALQQYLADVIDLTSVDVDAVDSQLVVQISYIVRRTGEQTSTTLEVST